MRRLIHGFVALVFLIAQTVTAPAWFTGGGQLQGFHVGGVDPPSITFIGCTEDTTPSDPQTFSGHAVGTAAAGRYTIVASLAIDDATSHATTSLTVGGDATTETIDGLGIVPPSVSLHIFANTTGTAEDIVVDYSEAMAITVAVCVWAAYGLASTTAVDSITDTDGSGGPSVLTLSPAPAAGTFTVGACVISDTLAMTWAVLTERADFGTDGIFSAADLSGSGSGSINCDVSASLEDIAGAAATYQ